MKNIKYEILDVQYTESIAFGDTIDYDLKLLIKELIWYQIEDSVYNSVQDSVWYSIWDSRN